MQMELAGDNNRHSRGSKGTNKKKDIVFKYQGGDGIQATLYITGPEEIVRGRFGSWPVDIDNPMKLKVLMSDDPNTTASQLSDAMIALEEEENAKTAANDGGPGAQDTAETTADKDDEGDAEADALDMLGKEIKQLAA